MDGQNQLNEIAEYFSMVYGRQFNPKVSKSTKWKRWYAFITPQTCTPCLNKNGTLFNEEHPLDKTPPLHEHCRFYLDAAITNVFSRNSDVSLFHNSKYLAVMETISQNSFRRLRCNEVPGICLANSLPKLDFDSGKHRKCFPTRHIHYGNHRRNSNN